MVNDNLIDILKTKRKYIYMDLLTNMLTFIVTMILAQHSIIINMNIKEIRVGVYGFLYLYYTIYGFSAVFAIITLLLRKHSTKIYTKTQNVSFFELTLLTAFYILYPGFRLQSKIVAFQIVLIICSFIL